MNKLISLLNRIMPEWKLSETHTLRYILTDPRDLNVPYRIARTGFGMSNPDIAIENDKIDVFGHVDVHQSRRTGKYLASFRTYATSPPTLIYAGRGETTKSALQTAEENWAQQMPKTPIPGNPFSDVLEELGESTYIDHLTDLLKKAENQVIYTGCE